MSVANWEFSYAGVKFPPPIEKGLIFRLQPVVDFERTANADAFIQPIAKHYTANASWGRLNGEQVHVILSTIDAIPVGELVFFNITKNAIDNKMVYPGAGISVTYNRYDDDLKIQRYSSLKINFITTIGERYN